MPNLILSPCGHVLHTPLGRLHAQHGKGGIRSDKREGDGATPVGSFALRRVFYRPDKWGPLPDCALPLIEITQKMGWCDDPKSPDYNRLITLPHTAGHEQMWRSDGLYDLVIELGYNDDPPSPGKGSAIFMHCAAPDWRGTEGCIVIERSQLLALLPQLTPESLLTVQPAMPDLRVLFTDNPTRLAHIRRVVSTALILEDAFRREAAHGRPGAAGAEGEEDTCTDDTQGAQSIESHAKLSVSKGSPPFGRGGPGERSVPRLAVEEEAGFGGKLVQAALYHDIAYAPDLRQSGFHPVDGAHQAAQDELPADVVDAVLHHSGAFGEMERMQPDLRADYGQACRMMQTKLSRALTFCDLRSGADGRPVSLTERLADIRDRHSRNHALLANLDAYDKQFRQIDQEFAHLLG
ncbi:MAG: hypothetical protein Alpg2KO_17130 [Alphaproteobacteria bacterium]